MNHRRAVVDQLVMHLEDAIKGDELLMKEVFEQCGDDDADVDDDLRKVNREMKKVIKLLRDHAKKGS